MASEPPSSTTNAAVTAEATDNGVAVTPGWSEAYYGDFIAGGGDRAIVMSYASSPVAELLFADPPVDTPPTAALLESCLEDLEALLDLANTESAACQDGLSALCGPSVGLALSQPASLSLRLVCHGRGSA